jgi:hypothetical protein
MSLIASMKRLARGCPPGWKLTRAVTLGLDPATEKHLRMCEACWAEVDSLHNVIGRAKAALPEPELPSDAERDAISLRLLASAPLVPVGTRGHLKAWVAVAVAAALATAAVLLVVKRAATSGRPSPESLAARPTSVASVRAIDGARFSRVQAPPDELLRLDDGTIELQILHLGPGERFRVLTGDAEVEVRGTRFRAVARNQRLTAVHVWEGRVEVRPFSGGAAVLDPGDDWERGRPGDDEKHEPLESGGAAIRAPKVQERAHGLAPASSPPANHSSRGPASPRRAAEPSDEPGAGDFDRAWALLRRGDAQKAAEAFAHVEGLARGKPLEEDALYWRAVATARTKDPQASALFAEFLDRFPSSSRAGEAAVALGWLRLDEGRREDARRLFTRASTDALPQVAASAREGLRRVGD